MARDTRKRFSSVDALKKFTPARLYQFLLEFPDYVAGVGLHWDATDEEVPYERLVDLFMNKSGKAPQAFLTAMFYINAMATTGGMLQIKAQARRDNIPLKAEGKCTTHDFAFVGWKAHPELLPRAYARGSASKKRASVTYQTEVASIPDWQVNFDSRRAGFIAVMDDHFLGDQQGEGTRITPYVDTEMAGEDAEPGAVWFLVRRGGGHIRQGSIEKDKESGLVEYTAELYDAAVYSPPVGELRVYAPGRDREPYRRAFGDLLGGSERFFSRSGLITLDPLKSGSPDAIRLKGFEEKIKRIVLRELRYRVSGDGDEYYTHSAPDLFALVTEDVPLMPEGAKPEEASFDVFFCREPKVRHTLTIIPPDLARYTRDDDAPTIEAWLRKREFKLSFRPATKA